MADLQLALQFVEHGDLPVACRDPDDGLNLAGVLVVPETGAEDVIRRNYVVESSLNDLFRSRRDYVKVKPVPVDPLVQYLGKQADVLFQADSFAGLCQMFATDTPVLRIMQQQIGQFAPLLDQVDS